MQLARQAATAEQQLVLAAGGDGTLGEVANGLAGTKTVMAPLPVGTANSFARELLMPRPGRFGRHRLLQAADSLMGGVVQQMDLGYTYTPSADDPTSNGRYWLLWAGVGADGFLVNEVEPRPKWSKKLGAFGYMLQGLTVVPRLPQMRARVEVDGRLFEDEYVLVTISNCRLYAGGMLRLNPQARLDDGLFEVWLYRGRSFSRIARYFVETMRGHHHHDPDVTMVNGRCVTIHTDPVMPCQTDGERAGHTPLACTIKPQALRVLIPNTAPADLFEQPGEPLPFSLDG